LYIFNQGFVFLVVYHDGKEAIKGRYSADVIYVALGRWLRFDDASVLFITDNEVCQPKPPCMPICCTLGVR